MVLIGELLIYMSYVGLSAFVTRITVLHCLKEDDDTTLPLTTPTMISNENLIDRNSLNEPFTVEYYSQNPDIFMRVNLFSPRFKPLSRNESIFQDPEQLELLDFSDDFESIESDKFEDFKDSEKFEVVMPEEKTESKGKKIESKNEVEVEIRPDLQPVFEWDAVEFDYSGESIDFYYAKEYYFGLVKERLNLEVI